MNTAGPILYRPISATELRTNTKPAFEKRQFNNKANLTSNTAAKALFGNYNFSQNHSVITANGWNSIKKWL